MTVKGAVKMRMNSSADSISTHFPDEVDNKEFLF